MGDTMTTSVWNITSHSERAIAAESARHANALASAASRTAFLFECLSQGVPQAEVPRLKQSAESFVADLRAFGAPNNDGKRAFRSLIPFDVVHDAFQDVEAVDGLAREIEEALEQPAHLGYAALVARLSEVSERFAEQAVNAGRANIDM